MSDINTPTPLFWSKRSRSEQGKVSFLLKMCNHDSLVNYVNLLRREEYKMTFDREDVGRKWFWSKRSRSEQRKVSFKKKI